MTTNTPPGWYAEPGHTGNGPAMERWWDGNAWTEYTRTAPVPDSSFNYPYASGDVIAGGPGGGGGRRRTGTVVIAIIAALVLIGGVVAGILVLGKGGDKKDAKDKGTPTPSVTLPHSVPTPSDGGSGGSDGSGGSQGTPSTGGRAVDAYDQISLPVPDGWKGTSGQGGIGASVETGDYPCPKDATQHCELGGVFAEPAAAVNVTATSPDAAAKADISRNAAQSYDARTYGATTSHQQLLSQAVTVAGQQGYLVRWEVTTQSGTSGYVESLAFPSPTDHSKLVVVRFGFDVGGKAPGQDVMDQITQGIKSDTSGGPVDGNPGGSGTGV